LGEGRNLKGRAVKFTDFLLVAILVTITSAIGSTIGHALLTFGQQAALAMFGGRS
jgi:hypothetical protein